MAGKNKQTSNTAAVDANGFEKLDTIDGTEGVSFADAKWVEPGEGVTIAGELVRAFVTKDTLGGEKDFRACYVVKDANGVEETFGEKAAFRQAIQGLKLGDTITLTFKTKEAIMKNNRPTGKEAWRVDLFVNRTGKGRKVIDELLASHRALIAAGADLPF